MNTEKVYKKIVSFVSTYIKRFRFEKAILGVSGGIDSALTLAVLSDALKKEQIHCVLMPYYKNNHFDDAINIVNIFGMDYSTIWINKIYDSFHDTGLLWKDATKENTMSRIRMILLYACASEHNGVVVGTTNASESYVGYLTKFGDGGVDIEPLLNLSKKHVYELVSYFNDMHKKKGLHIPEEVISKEPTADLRPDQTDEDDLGSYDTIDKMIDFLRYGIPTHDVSVEDKQRFFELYDSSEHKRSVPKSPHIDIKDLVPNFGKR